MKVNSTFNVTVLLQNRIDRKLHLKSPIKYSKKCTQFTVSINTSHFFRLINFSICYLKYSCYLYQILFVRALHKAVTLDKCIYMVESYELVLSKAEVIDREIRSLYAIKIYEDLTWSLSIIQRELTPPSIISYPQIID